MIEETAKAVGKTADAAKEIIAAARELGSWTSRIFGRSIEDVGEIAGAWTSYWKDRNAIVIKERVERLHEQRGITDPSPLPLRLGMPLLEAASLEDDPTLQEMWAALIANATDPGRQQDAKKAFTYILREIEPEDAVVLRFLVQKYQGHERRLPLGDAAASLQMDDRALHASLDRLYRSGCVSFKPFVGTLLTADDAAVAENQPIVTAPHGDYTITSLAFDLMSACNPT